MQKQEFLSRWIEIIKRSSATLVYKQNFVNTVLRAIRNCSTRHTYDTAWARAVVEEAESRHISPDVTEIEISLEATARKMIRYYWDQTVYFDLNQGPNPLKQPRILRGVKKLIKEYYKTAGQNNPVPFEKAAFSPRLAEKLDVIVNDALEIVKGEVIPRFLQMGQFTEELVIYVRGQNVIQLPQAAAAAIAENSLLLTEAIYYRWSQLLEQYNTSPRLNRKVRIIDTADLRDRPLSYFEKYLDLENPDRICFYCGQPIADDKLFIDHVIPWTYLCSDDIWNLVYSHKGCRPVKTSQALPEFSMARLDRRNKALLDKISTYVETDMVAGVLQDAVSSGLARKKWVLCRE
ncbi:MAG: HNH endonuclease [Bacillota bacterium]